MPCGHQPPSFFQRKGDAPLAEQVVQRHRVEVVEVAPRSHVVVDLGEDRYVPRAPSIGQLVGVARYTRLPKCAGDARTPVHERPENVKDERAHGHTSKLLGPRPTVTGPAGPSRPSPGGCASFARAVSGIGPRQSAPTGRTGK